MKAKRPFNFDEAALSQMENIRRIGLRRLRNRSEIDDFVQETLLRAYAKRGQLRDETKFDRWIAAIANNLARDWNSAFYRKGREEPIDELPDIPDERTPHDILEQEEERRELHQAMGRLNEDDREMLRARYFDEASYGELQQKYGLSYSAVGFRLHRAKARLKKILTSTAAAFVFVFGGMQRAAWGGILFMTKTTKIIVGAAVAAAAILIGGYLWLNNAGAERESGIDSALTLEEQSPRMTPLSAVKSTGGESASGSASVQSEAGQIDSGASAVPQASNADHETTAAAPVEAETEEDAEADKQAAIDTFNAFDSAMKAFDLVKAQSMARGQAHVVLGRLVQTLDTSGANIMIQPPEKSPVNEFVYADGELRVTSDSNGGVPTILRKTDGKWYVESISAFVSPKDDRLLEHIEAGYLPMPPENLEAIEVIGVSELK